MADERASAVASLQLEVDMLTAKVRLLTVQMCNMEGSQQRKVGELKGQLEAAEAQLAQYQAIEGISAAGAELEWSSKGEPMASAAFASWCSCWAGFR